MPRARSTGGSPAKKGGKSASRHTTPRKKSKTPSRKGKSPGPKRARSRSIPKSRATPKKTPRKSPSKSPKAKTPRSRPSRSRSRSSQRSAGRQNEPRIQTLGQKVKDAAQAIEHKISTPIQSFTSGLRSRRAAHDHALSRLGHTTTSTAVRRLPPAQSIWQRVRNSRIVGHIRSIPRRLRWNNVKRHFKRNWRRYAIISLIAVAGYYSYHNKKAIEKALQDQYNKLSDLIQQQKGSTFSKYFSGWFDESSSTTRQSPSTTPPRTAQQVPQPPHHSTKN